MKKLAMGKAMVSGITILLGLLIYCAPVLRVVAGDEAPIYLSETDNFHIYILDAQVKRIVFSQNLGVGIDSPKKEEETIDLVLKDKLPGNSLVLRPKGEVLQTKTVYNKPFSIPFAVEEGEQMVLKFEVNGAPAVDLKSGCCVVPGCPPVCGYCAVMFSYAASIGLAEEETNPGIKPSQWAEVGLSVEPRELKLDQDNRVTLSLSFTSRNLQNPWYSFNIPRSKEVAEISVREYPLRLNERKERDGVKLWERLETPLNSLIEITLNIKPSRKGELYLSGIASAGGDLNGLIFPEVELETDRDINKTASSNILYQLSEVLYVR